MNLNCIFLFQEKPLKGLSWSVGAVGNATWSGARLCDVLKDLNIDEEKYNHVQVVKILSKGNFQLK